MEKSLAQGRTQFSATECPSPEGGTCWQAGHPLEFHEWLSDMGGSSWNLPQPLLQIAGWPASLIRVCSWALSPWKPADSQVPLHQTWQTCLQGLV